MVTAEQVKELREMTGAGVMDCKKVLVETDGNMDKAVELLRERGIAISLTNVLNSSFLETKSVSEFTSTNAPYLPL